MVWWQNISPAESVAIKLKRWGWFTNPYISLTDEELLKILFRMDKIDLNIPLFSQACSRARNLFLHEIPELLIMKRETSTKLEIRAPYTFKTGSVYHGEWIGSRRHGYGRQIWKDGSYYEGYWENNCAHGAGRFVYPRKIESRDKSILNNDNNFIQDKKWDHPVDYDLEAKNSSVAVSAGINSEENLIQGFDDYKEKDGDEYIGEWRMSMAWGLGRFVAREGGNSYAGQWERDQKCGYGVETLDKAAVYVGEFKNNLRDGPGVLVLGDGTRYSGIWHMGRINGSGRIFGPNNTSLYEGNLLDGLRHGVGRLTIGPTIYQGEFQYDSKTGFGEYVWEDGRSYLGTWKDDSMHGAGTIIKDPSKNKSVECALRYGQVIALSVVNQDAKDS